MGYQHIVMPLPSQYIT